MRPKDLYFTLGMDKGLYSKVKIENNDPYYDSIRYIKVNSTKKATKIMYIIDKHMAHKSPVVREYMRVMTRGQVTYIRYHEESDKFELTSNEIIKANGYAGCACEPEYFLEELIRRRDDMENF